MSYPDFEYCSLVLIHVAVVRRTEYGYDTWHLVRLLPVVHFVALALDLMRPDNECQVVII